MKILDKYILRQFLINFVILTVVMMLLFVLVDLIVDLDEFLKAGEAHKKAFGGKWLATIGVVVGFYGPLLPFIYTYFSGLLVVAAMGFTLTAMQRSRELVAISASGISLFRIAAPILVAGIALSVLVLPIQEFVVPHLINKLSRSKSQLEDDRPQSNPVYYAADENGNLISAADFDPARQQMDDVTILERDENGIATRRTSATSALWNEEHQRWKLIGGLAITPTTDDALPSFGRDSEPVEFFTTQLSPTVVRARQEAITMRLLSLGHLQQMQTNEAVGDAQRAQVVQVIWSRFSLLVVNVLILAMTLPVFLTKLPVHYVAQSTKAAALSMGAWGSALMAVQVSTTMLNPVASAWLPVVIYLPLTAILLQRVDN